MTNAAADALKSHTLSPLIAGLFASNGVLTEAETGQAVLIILGGGAFLLHIVVKVMQLLALAKAKKADTPTARLARAEEADLVTREELILTKAEFHTSLSTFRTELAQGLALLTADFNETTRDMTRAIGVLQGLHDAQKGRRPQ